jgi:ADP-ribose pyrophosphatase
MAAVNRKAEIKSRRLLADDFFQLEEAYVAFEKHDGTMSAPVRRLDLKRKDAVCALVINRAKGTVVLVRQFRYAALERGQGWPLEIVAGLIDAGEEPIDAIRREILEETGFAVGALTKLFTFYPSPGITSERGILFVCDTEGEAPVAAGGGLAEESEDIEVLQVPFAEAFDMVERGDIYDGKTIIGLLWLKDRLPPR